MKVEYQKIILSFIFTNRLFTANTKLKFFILIIHNIPEHKLNVFG